MEPRVDKPTRPGYKVTQDYERVVYPSQFVEPKNERVNIEPIKEKPTFKEKAAMPVKINRSQFVSVFLAGVATGILAMVLGYVLIRWL